ncbi:hypothetical protein [Cryobacterium sp. Y50]|uniref:hypothetical protein n=1 Tax=Cryobacterium sp. Y50 TaxID=2048286 RepID=UPI001E4ADB5E|nr:hypothetical protein [Cryobacterium sp. Y50]
MKKARFGDQHRPRWRPFLVDATLTQTQPPIPLSLYSPTGSPDLCQDPENAGVSDKAILTKIPAELFQHED